jgi:hypothetical protein
MSTDIINRTHTDTTRLSIHEVVRRLIGHLGPTLVATLANVRDRKLPHKWAQADGPTPRDEASTRLYAAHRIWSALSASESDHVARAWFIGANPRLDEQQPVFALREGRISETMSALQAFLDGTDE